jgi:hypothetical protein
MISKFKLPAIVGAHLACATWDLPPLPCLVQAVESLPVPDVLEQRLQELIGLGPALLQDRDLLNEAQVHACMHHGSVDNIESRSGTIGLPRTSF